MTVGARTRYAQFYSITDERELSFYYTVRPDDHDADGTSIPGNSLSLNGGAITLAGDAATDSARIHAAVDAGRFGRVDGTLTMVGAVLQTIVRTWKQLPDAILDFIAPYRVTHSYPSETPCPQAN